MKALIGLGNIGEKYRGTRHNIGFAVIDKLSEQFGLALTNRSFLYTSGSGDIESKGVILVKPLGYMNRSGYAVRHIIKDFVLNLSDIIIIHDDIDLELGVVKKKISGGDGGHRGIRSIIEQLGTQKFKRIRVGVGRPPAPEFAAEYVLSHFKKDERETIKCSIGKSINKIVEELYAE